MLCSLLSIAVARPTQGRSVSAFQQAGGPGRDLLALREMGCEATGAAPGWRWQRLPYTNLLVAPVLGHHGPS